MKFYTLFATIAPPCAVIASLAVFTDHHIEPQCAQQAILEHGVVVHHDGYVANRWQVAHHAAKDAGPRQPLLPRCVEAPTIVVALVVVALRT